MYAGGSIFYSPGILVPNLARNVHNVWVFSMYVCHVFHHILEDEVKLKQGNLTMSNLPIAGKLVEEYLKKHEFLKVKVLAK